jgi:hypothetical protein
LLLTSLLLLASHNNPAAVVTFPAVPGVPAVACDPAVAVALLLLYFFKIFYFRHRTTITGTRKKSIDAQLWHYPLALGHFHAICAKIFSSFR